MVKDREAVLQDLLDREEIKELIYQYGRGVDDLRPEMVLSCFDSPCAVECPLAWGKETVRHEGREQVEAFFAQRATSNAESRFLRHRYNNPIIEVDGDNASNTVYWDEYRELNNQFLLGGGIYRDKLRRTPGGWRFTERVMKPTYLLYLVDGVDEAIRSGKLMLNQR
jgi:hypothetical protein